MYFICPLCVLSMCKCYAYVTVNLRDGDCPNGLFPFLRNVGIFKKSKWNYCRGGIVTHTNIQAKAGMV